MFEAIGTFVVALLIMPVLLVFSLISALWRAWWLYPAWGWFVVPLGGPFIAFGTFAGLMVLLEVVTRPLVPAPVRVMPVDWWGWLAQSVFSPMICWVFFWALWRLT